MWPPWCRETPPLLPLYVLEKHGDWLEPSDTFGARALSVRTEAGASLHPPNSSNPGLSHEEIRSWEEETLANKPSVDANHNSWQQMAFWESLMCSYCNNEGTIQPTSPRACLPIVGLYLQTRSPGRDFRRPPPLTTLAVVISAPHPHFKPSEYPPHSEHQRLTGSPWGAWTLGHPSAERPPPLQRAAMPKPVYTS